MLSLLPQVTIFLDSTRLDWVWMFLMECPSATHLATIFRMLLVLVPPPPSPKPSLWVIICFDNFSTNLFILPSLTHLNSLSFLLLLLPLSIFCAYTHFFYIFLSERKLTLITVGRINSIVYPVDGGMEVEGPCLSHSIYLSHVLFRSVLILFRSNEDELAFVIPLILCPFTLPPSLSSPLLDLLNNHITL